MSGQNTIVVIYAIPTAVMRAIGKLQDSGCDIEFSVVAKEDREATRSATTSKDYWCRLRSLLPDWARFAIPEIGPLLIAGPMSGLMVSVLNNESMFNGLKPLEACFHSLGLPRERILACEAAVQAGGILLLIHGPEEDVREAGELLASTWNIPPAH
jgi:hypothetical protein